MIEYNVELIMALIVFTFSFAIAFLLVPLSKKISFKVGAVAHPRERDVHKKPMPRMGGISIVFATSISILLFSGVLKDLEPKKLFAILFAGILVFLVGFFDDIYEFSAKYKFLGQTVAAVIVVMAGVRIEALTWPFAEDGLIKFGVFAIPITLIWILGMTNAVNFIDGLDGLAAGVSSIGAIYIMIISIFLGTNSIVLITAALAGACVGFLPYNFNPAQIFMGDTGALFVGFMLSIASILGLFKGYATIVVLVIILGIPIFDTGFAIVRRMLSGKTLLQAMTTADRGHLHHRLVDSGLSHRKSVLVLYAIALMLGTTGVFIVLKSLYMASVTFFIVALWIYFILSKKTKKSEE